MAPTRVALLTAGGYAPCLSSAVGALIETWTSRSPETEIVAYRHGYEGLLRGDSIVVDDAARRGAALLHRFGGSPIGNSRVKLTNDEDCRRRGLVGPDETALDVAARQLVADGVEVLHTIGGDDTNTAAADLAAHLARQQIDLTVVGLPKTIDNDVVPIKQTLGAQTAAEQAALFARNILAEHGANPRMLIVHEVMGRGSGWLTAAAGRDYMRWHGEQEWLPSIGLTPERWAIHGLYVPEVPIDIEAEATRLRGVMDEIGCVNIFLSEGAGVADIVRELEEAGTPVKRDPFGHVMLDTINPGRYFAKQFAQRIGAQKKMVQKSGYFSRSAPANATDVALVREMCELAVESALDGVPGVIGHDEERGDVLRAIEFERIAGHKPFDATQPWFTEMLREIGQTTP
ncbi:pyrophosphate--fructose-6-phosphate 1-phosphotransferase [Nocardioides jishulii]|uniref:Pyrophosphate--fructose-6-phosphate 1-phosphotransferase n=1 Tax=Nocardioides jishulii TaxID=2575440 RepID=A0A4U2YL41_9ACTN|nr:pyrophosphate--fructose-6-phosphate 1-phosphotransferase [Nocardioides jishulii]QCX27155.1 pyrophosphate--fructose-6-phosphate 1-phosphotransferase [Nocardioides jishulii]TKI61640.1 pyrophosphate--fructose-6-phosphate 1-phosphotransferase [Nocardioides jishulii]